MTVVFDTNIVVSALVVRGLCHEAFHRAVRMRVLASSVQLMDELEATLRRKFVVSPPVTAFLASFREQIRIVEPPALPAPVCRDPDDDVVLATAVAAAADLIVTGDQDLQILGTYKAIRIVSPRKFLELLESLPNAAGETQP